MTTASNAACKNFVVFRFSLLSMTIESKKTKKFVFLRYSMYAFNGFSHETRTRSLWVSGDLALGYGSKARRAVEKAWSSRVWRMLLLQVSSPDFFKYQSTAISQVQKNSVLFASKLIFWSRDWKESVTSCYKYLLPSTCWGCFVCCRDRKNQIGEASCRICQEKFSTPIDGMHGLLFESQEKRSQQEWPSHQACSSWKTDLFLSITWSTDLHLVRCHGCVVKQITIILLWS